MYKDSELIETIVQYKSLLAIKVDFKILTTVVVKRTAAPRRQGG